MLSILVDNALKAENANNSLPGVFSPRLPVPTTTRNSDIDVQHIFFLLDILIHSEHCPILRSQGKNHHRSATVHGDNLSAALPSLSSFLEPILDLQILNMDKKYGLQLRVKPQQQKKPVTRPPLSKPALGFGGDDDEDDVEREISRQAYKNKSLRDVRIIDEEEEENFCLL